MKTMIQCDACWAMLDPKGIRAEVREEGELEIRFFRCGRCGAEYITSITDENLRERIRKIRGEAAYIRLMKKKQFKKETIAEKEKELETLRQSTLAEMKERKRTYLEAADGKEGADGRDPEGLGAGAGQGNPVDGGGTAQAVSGRDLLPDRGGEEMV